MSCAVGHCVSIGISGLHQMHAERFASCGLVDQAQPSSGAMICRAECTHV